MSVGDKIQGAEFKYSQKEKAIISIVRLNESTPKTEIEITKRVGPIEMTFRWRSSKNLWGRFGGGWNWKIGADIGSTSIIFNLLICSIRISWKKEVRYK